MLSLGMVSLMHVIKLSVSLTNAVKYAFLTQPLSEESEKF